jgi:hypothetical protein
MLENNLVNCFSEISLDKKKLDEIYKHEIDSYQNCEDKDSNNEDNCNKSIKSYEKLKKKIIYKTNYNIYGKENKESIERNRINKTIRNSISNNTRRLYNNSK